MIIQTCPKCGKDLFKTIICTYPSIPRWECQCGWSYEGEPEKIVRVPFNEGIGDKEIMDKKERWKC